jgi:hypothetical protein
VKTRTPLSFTTNKSTLPYLNNVNGVVNKWQVSQHNQQSQTIEMSVTTHMPLNLTISQGKDCKLVKNNTDFTVTVKGQNLSLTSLKAGTFTTVLECNNG